MIRQLKTKDQTDFIYYCQKRDKYSDFYITQNNQRIFLNDYKVSKKIFKNCLKHGDKCFIVKNQNIEGILIITGYSDGFARKYVKIFTDNSNKIYDLLKFLCWTTKIDLYIKCRHDNPIKKECQKLGFRPMDFRGQKRLVLCRKYDPKFVYSKKEGRK